jgi:peptide/nickel transport system permease protein
MARSRTALPIWILRRLLTSLLLVFLILSVVFVVVRLAPGDPMTTVLASTEEGFTEEEILDLRERYGLVGSLGDQYLRWIKGLLQLDLGMSLGQQRPVRDILADTIPPTLLLTSTAYALHLLLALGAGVAMSRFRGRWPDHGLQAAGLAFYSVPGFWLGLMAIMLLSRQLGWFPVSGMYSPDAQFMSGGARFLDLLHHLILPAGTLALGSFMGTARYLRASLDEVLGQDYILAARSRGVPERRVFLHHALRNALLPVITLLGLHLPFLLGGAVVTEVIFSWPGLGRVTVDAIWSRDYPVIMATTLAAAGSVVLGSLLADILYRAADPRLGSAEGGGGA